MYCSVGESNGITILATENVATGSYLLFSKFLPRSAGNMKCTIVHPPYEPGYVIPFVGNLTEEKSCLSILEFPIGV
jgi:hypothetical protein